MVGHPLVSQVVADVGISDWFGLPNHVSTDVVQPLYLIL